MNLIDEVKRLRPPVEPLSDDARRQLRRELFDAGTRQTHARGTDEVSVVEIREKWRHHPRTRRRVVGTAAAVVLTLAVGVAVVARSNDDQVVANTTAGSEASSTANGDDGAPWTPPTVAPSPPELPLVGHFAWRQLLPFYFSPSDNRRMYAVYQRHLADCADEAGVAFTPRTISGVDGLDLVSPLDRNAAEALGYHQPSDGLDMPPDLSSAEFDQMSACANTASKETYGATEEFSTAVQAALRPFDAAVNGWSDTEQGKARLAAWSACMADAGFDYSTPSEPKAIFENRPTLTETELSTRLADLGCDVEVGLTQARSAYEESAARRWIANNEALIADLVAQKADYYDTLERLESER